MGTRTKILATLALVSAGAVLAPPSAASAARSGVTIHHYYGGGVVGKVFSPKPQKCARARKVKLFRLKGKRPNPKRDTKVGKADAAGRASDNGGYGWEVQYNRARPGHYYARVPATPTCRADNSKTIRIAARPQTKITIVSVYQGQRGARFNYTAVGGITPYHFRCRLDDQQYQRCPKFGGHSGQSGAKSYRNLSRGRHVFKVRAIGANGERDQTPEKHVFRIKG
jgi:hypothetical protein